MFVTYFAAYILKSSSRILIKLRKKVPPTACNWISYNLQLTINDTDDTILVMYKIFHFASVIKGIT